MCRVQIVGMCEEQIVTVRVHDTISAEEGTLRLIDHDLSKDSGVRPICTQVRNQMFFGALRGAVLVLRLSSHMWLWLRCYV